MKQRLLVMNGQRLLQSEQAGQWQTDKVEKAGALGPGLYHLHLAARADPTQAHDGLILHADGSHVYQQCGRSVVRHDRGGFGRVPGTGDSVTIRYEAGRVVVEPSTGRPGRGGLR